MPVEAGSSSAAGDRRQEGHFVTKVPGRRIDYRVSFAPSVFGQKLVIRVQDKLIDASTKYQLKAIREQLLAARTK